MENLHETAGGGGHATATSRFARRRNRLLRQAGWASDDGEVYGLAALLGLDDEALQAVEPEAGVEHLAHLAVLAHEDAALCVAGGVAGVDAYALPLAVELGAAEQDGEPLLEARAPGYDHGVVPLGYGRAACYLAPAVLVVAPGGFEGIAEVGGIGM